MNLQEICKILGKSEITILTNFKRTQKNLLKKGIYLTKEGSGMQAKYNIKHLKGKYENNDYIRKI